MFFLGASGSTTTLSETVVTILEIQAPAEQVFACMADPRHAPASASNLGGAGRGATNHGTFALAGKRISGQGIRVDYTPPQRKVFAVSGDIDGAKHFWEPHLPGHKPRWKDSCRFAANTRRSGPGSTGIRRAIPGPPMFFASPFLPGAAEA